MTRILAFARDPGGANTVIPLLSPLRQRGHQLLLYGKDAALSSYRQARVEGKDVMAELAEVTPGSIRSWLERESPDLIVTGTSADDFTEKFIWQAAGELGIPSLAIVDQWINYSLRFSGHGVNDISSFDSASSRRYLPTRIVAPDDYARDEMVAEGLPAERIAVCGQPYFETVRGSAASEVPPAAADAGIEVLFASEPITTTYGKGALGYLGYTELTILSALLHALEKIAGEVAGRLTLVIRPHPKEGCGHFMHLVAGCRRLAWRFDADSAPWTLMNRCALVCGMSSMFLIESVLLGRPALSIQIGLRRDDPFVLSRRGVLPSVLSEQALEHALREIIVGSKRALPEFDVISDPVARVVAEMERLVCQNLR